MTGKTKLTLEQSIKSRKVLEVFSLGTRWGWVVKAKPRSLYTREGDSEPIIQDVGGGASRARLDGFEKFPPHRDSILRPSSP